MFTELRIIVMLNTFDSEIWTLEKKQRESIIELGERAVAILNSLEMPDIKRMVDQVISVARKPFTILVLGEFKVGKSALINALLREELLTSKAIPATAMVTVVKWGPVPKVLLHHVDEKIPPHEIALEDLEQFSVIRNSVDDVKSDEYAYIEIFSDLKIGEQNLSFVDSPGLNIQSVRQNIILNHLRQADGILYLFNALQIGPSKDDERMLTTIKELSQNKIFLIVNFIDLLPTGESERIRKYAEGRLAHFFDEKKEVFFISALKALEGKKANNLQTVADSGLPKLEGELYDYLINIRGRNRIRSQAEQLLYYIGEARKRLIDRKAALLMPHPEFMVHNHKFNARWQEVETGTQEISNHFSKSLNHLKFDVRQIVLIFILSLEQELDVWASQYPTPNLTGLLTKSGLKQTTNEFVEYLEQRVTKKLEAWSTGDFVKQLDDLLMNLFEDWNNQITKIEEEINLISRNPLTSKEVILHKNIGQGFGTNESIIGEQTDFNLKISQSALVGIISLFGTGAFSGVFSSLVIAVAAIQGGLTANAAWNRIRSDILLQFKIKIRELSKSLAEEVSEGVFEDLQDYKNKLELNLAAQVSEFGNQIKTQTEEASLSNKIQVNKIEENVLLLEKLSVDLDIFTQTLN